MKENSLKVLLPPQKLNIRATFDSGTKVYIEYENLKHQYPQAGTGKSRVPKELIDKLVDKYIPKDEDKTEDE